MHAVRHREPELLLVESSQRGRRRRAQREVLQPRLGCACFALLERREEGNEVALGIAHRDRGRTVLDQGQATALQARTVRIEGSPLMETEAGAAQLPRRARHEQDFAARRTAGDALAGRLGLAAEGLGVEARESLRIAGREFELREGSTDFHGRHP
jgi:hypothetical protein